MTPRRWSLLAVAYLAATAVAWTVVPFLHALVWFDLLPRLLVAVGR